MPSSKLQCGPAHKAAIYGILFISSAVPAFIAVRNMGISPDSMMYALVSQQILSGKGIAFPMIYDLRDTFLFTHGIIPFVLDPPLFPLLLALFGGVTPESFFAAQIINMVSHMATALFSYLLMRQVYGGRTVSLIVGILISLSLPLLWNVHRILTEPLFISLTLAALYFLILPRHAGQKHLYRNLVAASICTSLAVLTRFAGLALLPMFIWGSIVLVKDRVAAWNNRYSVTLLMLPLITTVALFSVTYSISGSLHGWSFPSPERSYPAAVAGTLRMILLQFNLGSYITVITAVASLLVLSIAVSAHTRLRLSGHLRAGLDLIIVFMVSHTVLIAHAMATSQTIFELRYMSPLVPFLFIAGVLIIAAVSDALRVKGCQRLAAGVLTIFLVVIASGNFYKSYRSADSWIASQPGHYRLLNSPTFNWISDNYGKNIIITTNRPYHLSFFGGYSTIRLPHRRFERNSWVPDDMESYLPERMARFGSRVLALFERADEQHEGRYLSKLFNEKQDDEKFLLVKEFSDGVVYELRE